MYLSLKIGQVVNGLLENKDHHSTTEQLPPFRASPMSVIRDTVKSRNPFPLTRKR